MENTMGSEEKVIVEKDRMSLPHALMILHQLHSRVFLGENVEEAFQVVFEFIDNMAILLGKLEDIYESKVNQAGLADTQGADQDDRSNS